MNIPTDEELVDMSREQLQLHMYTALQLRHHALKSNKFQTAQMYGDLICKCKELITVDDLIERCT
jgi:hypothetical protein